MGNKLKKLATDSLNASEEQSTNLKQTDDSRTAPPVTAASGGSNDPKQVPIAGGREGGGVGEGGGEGGAVQVSLQESSWRPQHFISV